MRLVHRIARLHRVLQTEVKRYPALEMFAIGFFFYSAGCRSPIGFAPLDWFTAAVPPIMLVMFFAAYIYQRWTGKVPH